MHCGYYRFDAPSMMPLVHWTASIAVWIRDHRHLIAFAVATGFVLSVSIGNVFSSLMLFLFDHGYFADIHIERVHICPSTDFGDPFCSEAAFDGLEPNQWDDTLSINNLPEYQPPSDWTGDLAEDIFIDSWITAMNDEMARIDSIEAALDSLFESDHFGFEQWTDFGHFNVTESGFSDPAHSILDDLWLEKEATERMLDELDFILNRSSYSSFGDEEWVRSFWTMIDGMDFGDVHFVEYVPESHLVANPFCSHYLEITASFQYPVLHRLAMSIIIGSMIVSILYLWSYWSILRTLSFVDALVHGIDLIDQWTALSLNRLTTECMFRCSDWNRFAVRRRLESEHDSRHQTSTVLAELDLFPDGINRIIEGMLFHDLVQEISAEKAMVSALDEEWGLKPATIRIIGLYAFSDREHSFQLHYPLNADGSFMLLAHFRLRTAMRPIRVVAVYTDNDGVLSLAVPPQNRANGQTLALDMESTGFVEPEYVIR